MSPAFEALLPEITRRAEVAAAEGIVPLADLIQASAVAVLKATRTYDPNGRSKGKTFEEWALETVDLAVEFELTRERMHLQVRAPVREVQPPDHRLYVAERMNQLWWLVNGLPRHQRDAFKSVYGIGRPKRNVRPIIRRRARIAALVARVMLAER